MNYDEFIQAIIITRGQWNIPKDTYKEMHHILPHCLGGEGDYDSGQFRKNSHNKNCIWLTASEHYIAHKLLVEKYPDNRHLLMAFTAMCYLARDKEHLHKLTAEEYEINKKIITKAQSRPGKLNGMYGRHRTSEEILKIKETRRIKKQNGEYAEGYKKLGEITSKRNKGCKWYNNGIIEKFCSDQPNGFIIGRLPTQGFRQNKINPSAKPIIIYDINWNILYEFSSGADAERFLGLPAKTIKKSVYPKRKSPYNNKYYFKWKEE